MHQRIQDQYHISVIEEPGSLYFSHVTADGHGAEEVAAALQKSLEENNAQLHFLRVIGTDGEPTNTGPKSGVIQRMETYLGHPVLRAICLLHSNELPLRHMIKEVDGDTSGPRGFSGPIGKSLANCETRPVRKFVPIETDLPVVNLEDTNLSRDQVYLYKMSAAISSGECSPGLGDLLPGPLNHARWLTTACRILREYMTHTRPSKKLQTLATFIVRVYVPTWFIIRTNSKLADAPKILWLMTVRIRYLEGKYLRVVQEVIQRNAYAAHPENVLFAMLADERRDVRADAVAKIMSVRKKQATPVEVRRFKIPEVNFSADDYTKIIDWESTEIFEPPVTKHLSDEHLSEIVEGKPPQSLEVYLNMPCHNQAVERCVKEVTEASRRVFGADARYGFVRARLLERQLNPKFETKAQFKTL